MRATHERRLVHQLRRHLGAEAALEVVGRERRKPSADTTTRVPPASGPPCGKLLTARATAVRRGVAVDVVYPARSASPAPARPADAGHSADDARAGCGAAHAGLTHRSRLALTSVAHRAAAAKAAVHAAEVGEARARHVEHAATVARPATGHTRLTCGPTARSTYAGPTRRTRRGQR